MVHPKPTRTATLVPSTTPFRSVARGCRAAVRLHDTLDRHHARGKGLIAVQVHDPQARIAVALGAQRRDALNDRARRGAVPASDTLSREIGLSVVGGGAPEGVRAAIDAAVYARRRNDRDRKRTTSELQSLLRISDAVFCLKKKKT